MLFFLIIQLNPIYAIDKCQHMSSFPKSTTQITATLSTY